MTSDTVIETPRLRLVTLCDAALERLRDGDVDAASLAQGFTFTDEFLETVNAVFLSIHLEGLRRHPSAPGWFVRAIVRTSDARLIGHCGFHGAPLDVGRAEIGYTVFAPYRGQGFATEAARALVAWAMAQGSTSVFASVAPTNAPSLALVRSLGFARVETHTNARGDEEYVFELHA